MERKVICNNFEAFFFTPDNPQDLARVVKEVLADPAGATTRAACATALVKEYTWAARANVISSFLV